MSDLPGTDMVPLDQQIAEVGARMDRLSAEAAELADQAEQASSGALVPVSGRGPAEIKRTMAEMRGLAIRKRDEIKAAQEEMRRLLEARAAQAREALAPLEKMMARLVDGIEAVNLYLGTSEEIVTLRDGAPAPASEPLVVRQQVLAMDEECAVAAETGGIDAVSIDRFDAWLLEDPAHLDQVLPEAKGIVALVPRLTTKDYGDPWQQQRMDDANSTTYFLVRNGERLFRICADFKVGTRLVPASDEFTRFFEEKVWVADPSGPTGGGHYEKRAMQPGSFSWQRAEEQADARQKHHFKIALLIQGLVARTPVFHPLPDGTVDFLDERSYDSGAVRIIADAEAALGDGSEPFDAWLTRLNGLLRPGMRIIGAFRGAEFGQWRSERGGGHERLHPPMAEPPATGVIYTIEERKSDGGLVFRYQRTERIWVEDDWGRSEHRLPKTRASCVVYPSDRFVLPYDLVTVEEMERFLRSRASRRSYITMFPVLKAAIAAKRAEAAEEEPLRFLVASQIAAHNGVDVADALADVPGLVDWWKLANRHHRALVGTDHPKTLDAIVAEHRRRLASRKRGTSAELVERLRADHGDALLIARKHSGAYVVLVPHGDGPFVAEIEYRASGKVVSTAEWRLVGPRPNRWETLWAAPAWAGWDRGASLGLHLSDPEMEQLASSLAEAPRFDAPYGALLGVTYDPRERKFSTWQATHGARIDEDHLLTHPPQDVRVTQRRWGWSRTTGQRAVLEGGRAHESRWQHNASLPWDSSRNLTLLRFDEALADLEAERGRYSAAAKRHDALRAQVREHLERVAQAWERRAEEAEHRRFIAEYLDESLWEGHKKTLGRALQYPHHHHEGLVEAVSLLVEAGLRPEGQTVAAATVLAKALAEPGLHKRGWSEIRGWISEPSAPDDVLDLTL